LAALTQATVRMLCRLARKNQRWRIYDSFLLGENRWRAQRYGTSEGLIDFGRSEILDFGMLAAEWLGIIEEDASALRSVAETTRIQDMVSAGTSADRQRKAYDGARSGGADHDDALRVVVGHLIEEFHADL